MGSINLLTQELKAQGISDQKVLAAIQSVPRELFVPKDLKKHAYENTALPIALQQTISQPYIVALMTQALRTPPLPHKILEIGTGSGYQTAILASLFDEIWTIERLCPLQDSAKKILNTLTLNPIHYLCGDGSNGWPDYAPFDAIIVTAAASKVPQTLLKQLSPNQGKMIIPVGGQHKVQNLTLITRNQNEYSEIIIEQVSFVPLIADDNHLSLE